MEAAFNFRLNFDLAKGAVVLLLSPAEQEGRRIFSRTKLFLETSSAYLEAFDLNDYKGN